MKGKLVLIPSFLGHHPLEISHPPQVLERVHTIEHFAVERLQSAVQFLNKSGHPTPEFKLIFHPLDKHVTPIQLNDIVQVLEKGNDVGVLSEAGCPGIADPGAELVWLCQLRGIEVVPMVGPSAIILAVMAAGLNGQNFAFNGYLPVQSDRRELKIREHQNRSVSDFQTQVYIEAPYRNEELLKALLDVLQSDARLGVCWNLMAEDQWIHSAEVMNWQTVKLPAEFNKKPAMFLFLGTSRGEAKRDSVRADSRIKGKKVKSRSDNRHRPKF